MAFNSKAFQHSIYSAKSFNFNEKAIELFHYQYKNNAIYKTYCDLINCNVEAVNSIENIPFLPISTFKKFEVKSGNFKASHIFTSSGTSGTTASKHFVKSIDIYKLSFNAAFSKFYGNVAEYTVLGLLPAYLERKGSSLIFMVQDFINQSKYPESGFFLNNKKELATILKSLAEKKQKTLLIGVSFGLLDFVEEYQVPFNENLIVMETGGMKGRRKEMVREELHSYLKSGFRTSKIHSEYGMTELLSQAYSKGNGVFNCPPWMKIILRKQDDPLNYSLGNNSGAINCIDLANIDSCAFIATDDLGEKYDDGSFSVLGRFDSSEVRGCNLMVV